MARTRPRSTSLAAFRRGRLALLAPALVVLLAGAGGTAAGREPLSESPVIWYAADDAPSEVPEFSEPGLVPYAVDSFLARPFSRFFHPGRLVRRIGTGDAARPAGDVNALDEVVNSSWFTNRIGLRPLTAAELACGPALGMPQAAGPDRSAPWTIIGAKSDGVTPGFRIRDARGDVWLLKFDPPSHPGMTIRSGVISNLIFHAIGFNTPIDRLVVFDRADLVVGADARMRAGRYDDVPLTPANLDSILAATNSVFDGRYHALASRYLDGIPLGPFDDQDTRPDDPNDLVKHENRRQLRALQVFGAWVNHFDTKMHNSLDMYVGEPGEGHVVHHLIDFASTLGAYGDTPVKRFGYEAGIDLWPSVGRIVTLGLVEDRWVALERPAGLAEVGLFDVATFAPELWTPDLPHSGMANLTARDGYWAAKIVAAFSDDDLRIIVAQGRYRNPAAEAYMIRTLAERRDRIVRYWFGEVPPLDFFRAEGDRIRCDDLAVARGYAAAGASRYRYRLFAGDAERRRRDVSVWRETDRPAIPLAGPDGVRSAEVPAPDAHHRFLGLEIQVDRGEGWSESTVAWFAHDLRCVAVDR
jgi:hypothetical protein